jgi:hypothetical protein
MRENYFRLLEKVQKIKEKMFHFLKNGKAAIWLLTMIQWHHHKGEAKIPKTDAERCHR